ncbi:MAG: hypothetical protein KatS3mg001_087 [Candidatus Pacearchaeota archaeon]|nr:MAG: hypothetical protein KatS3mg001_087 [Candidatus Pacearchaeota archaeon]
MPISKKISRSKNFSLRKNYDKNFERKKEAVSFFLRAGLAVVFFYAAFSSFLFPENWIGFIPLFLKKMFSQEILLLLFSLYEIFLGLWLLSNKKTFYAAFFSAITMFLIIISNIILFDIVFRDIAIMFMAIALAFLSKDERGGSG